MIRRAIVLLAGVLMLAGCTPATLLNVLSFGDFTVLHDVAYEPGARGKLDVYLPRDAKGAPVVVFFYGGSWQEGSKSQYRFVGAALAARGIIAVIPDYRVYPEVRFPGFLEDGAAAVRFSRDHAAGWGGDTSHLFLMGHSAGAHIAAMLALDPQWLRQQNMEPAAIKGLIGLAGPYDFLPLTDPVLKVIFGDPAQLARTQPINFVTPQAPPAFLAAGLDDKIVDPGNSRRLAARLQGAGVPVKLVLYPGVDHVKLAGALSPLLSGIAPVLQEVVGFIKGKS